MLGQPWQTNIRSFGLRHWIMSIHVERGDNSFDIGPRPWARKTSLSIQIALRLLLLPTLMETSIRWDSSWGGKEKAITQILGLLEAICLPKKVTKIYYKGHQEDHFPEAIVIRFANQDAKEAALEPVGFSAKFLWPCPSPFYRLFLCAEEGTVSYLIPSHLTSFRTRLDSSIFQMGTCPFLNNGN